MTERTVHQATIQATLKRLHALGYNPIPLRDGKIPAVRWSNFHDRRATADELAVFSAMRMDGVGVVCGGATELMVLDIDELRMVEVVKPFLPREVLGRTVWYSTTRGFHLWFRRPENVPATLGKLQRERVELLGFKHFAKCPPRESSTTFGGSGLKPLLLLPEVPGDLLEWLQTGEENLGQDGEQLSPPRSGSPPCSGSSLVSYFFREGRSPIPEGERNDTLFRVACCVLGRRSRESYEHVCVRLVNIAVEVDGLSREEALACVDNAYSTIRPRRSQQGGSTCDLERAKRNV